jgi:hypothetical protein
MSQTADPITRAAALAVKTPLLISAAVTTATANVVSWELRQLARLPLSAGARQVRRPHLELVCGPPGNRGSRDHRGKLRAVR